MTDAEQLEVLGNELTDLQVRYRAASVSERLKLAGLMIANKAEYAELQAKIIKANT
jgi:hypothetical protein